MSDTYAGDVSPQAAWTALEADPSAVLIDVRTKAEWNYVGVPDLARLGRKVLLIEWQGWPEGTRNPSFVDEVTKAGVTPDQATYLLCRSGARSRSAAELLTQHGWKSAFNVSDGFEGPHNPAKHRGTVAGWKHDGLPWTKGNAMKASATWLEGRMFVGESGSGHAVVMDGPPDAGGRNIGVRPMEMLLLGLAGCTAFDVVHILERGRDPVRSCKVEVEAERAETDPKVFTKIRLRYRVGGANLALAKVERAVALSAEKYCSASIMLGATASISHEIELIDG